MTSCMICFQHTFFSSSLCQECLDNLIKIDFTEVCPKCNRVNVAAKECGRCLQYSWHFEHLYSGYHYNAMAKYLLVQLKFHHRLVFLPELAKLMLLALREHLELKPPEVLVPVPMHRWRMFQRGFNQAFELAKYLGRVMNIKVAPNLAYKIKHTKAQALLDFKNRQRNIKASFKVKLNQVPQSLWIIDDVFTTGATVNALAYEFIKAGVKEVRVATLFRAS